MIQGRLAQLGEHHVRNVGVGGSNPLPSIINMLKIYKYKKSPVLYVFAAAVVLFLGISVAPKISFGAEKVLRASDNRIVSFKQMIDDIKRVNIVFVGEFHDNEDHHRYQLNIIKALSDAGIPAAVGLEMFASDFQKDLDMWVSKDISLNDFLEVYNNNWLYSWSLYRDIFLHARDNNIPMVGLNVLRTITQKVSIYGISSLTNEEISALPPDLICEIDSKAIDILKSVYQSHNKENFIYFCEAQAIWDKAMAMNIMKFIEKNPEGLLVVLAGTGHSMKFGIPYQIRKNSGFFYRVIIPDVPIRDREITAQYADYIILK